MTRSNATKDRARPPQYDALDGCRGICAGMVAFYHWRAVLGVSVNSHLAQFRIVQNAYLFVDFFFVLSGFVIAARYQDRLSAHTVRLSTFLALRIGRLLPLQLFTLGLTLIVVKTLLIPEHDWATFAIPVEDVSASAFALNLFLLQGIHTTSVLTWNHPSWSISAEFFTYMLFGVAWYALRSRASVVVAALILVMPFAILRLKGQMNVTYDWGFLRALYGFAIGVAICNAVRHPRARAFVQRSSVTAVTIAEALALAASLWFVWFADLKPISIAAPVVFGVVVAILSAQHGAISRLLALKPGRELGRLSYSIYLLQFPLQQVLMCFAVWLGSAGQDWLFAMPAAESTAIPTLGMTPFVGDFTNVVMLAFLIAASALTYRFIESPGRNWVRARVARN